MRKQKKHLTRFLSLLCLLCLCMTSIFAYPIEVALTFDDLPAYGNKPDAANAETVANQVLGVLKKHHLDGVYGFVNGNLSEDKTNLAILQKWVDEGQLLGNHTYSHLDVNLTTPSNYMEDINKNDILLASLMKNKNYHFFRYPFLAEGDTQEKRDQLRQFISDQNYTIAPVTIDFYDYAWNEPYLRCLKKNDVAALSWLKKSYIQQSLIALNVAHRLSMTLFERDVKNILLLHIGAFQAAMLDELLTTYENNGIKFISLPDAMSDVIYQVNPNVVSERNYTLLNQLRLSQGLPTPKVVQDWRATLPIGTLDRICREN